jgi:hypothetical protein
MSITDRLSAFAHFQFSSNKSLFQCFNLLRLISEVSRRDEIWFRKAVSEICAQKNRDETPFASIEVELSECLQSLEFPESRELTTPIKTISEFDSTILGPIKYIMEYCNHLHFDIHIKLRLLFFVSFVSFLLKFMSFLPLVALLICVYLLWTAWERLDRGSLEPEKKGMERFLRVQNFLADWFEWKNPDKSWLLFRVCCGVFLAWAIFPTWIYVILCCLGYFFGILRPLYMSRVFQRIASGFWFCT